MRRRIFFRENVAKKGVFLILHHIGLVDGHHCTHAAVDVRLHQPVDGFRCRARIVEGVIVNGGHTEFQHLDRPQHGAHVIEMRGGRLVAEGRDFVEHEDLERGIVGCALEEVAGRVEVPVDESRHCKQVVGRDDLEVLPLRSKRRDPVRCRRSGSRGRGYPPAGIPYRRRRL